MSSPAVTIPRASRAAARLGPIPAIPATGLSIRSPLLSDPSPVILRERLGEGSGLIDAARKERESSLRSRMTQKKTAKKRGEAAQVHLESRHPHLPAAMRPAASPVK